MASGIILALLGCGFGLLSAIYLVFIPMMTGALSATPPPGAPAGSDPAELMKQMAGIMIAAGSLFGLVALLFLTAGFGSMFLKRWARPLALFLSVVWIYVGTLYLLWILLSATGMRRLMAEEFAKAGATAGSGPGAAPVAAPEAIFGVMILVGMTFAFVFGVLLPALVLWLNWHPDVKVTLEFCDPKPRWTDRCPAPVLGISLAAAGMALSCLSLFAIPAFPLFGFMLGTGASRAAAGVLCLVLLAVAWGAYRRLFIAWLACLLLTLALGASAILSAQDAGIYRDIYASMGMPEEMIQQSLKSIEIYMSPANVWIGSLAAVLPVLAYLFWVFRYFRPGGTRPPLPAVAAA